MWKFRFCGTAFDTFLPNGANCVQGDMAADAETSRAVSADFSVEDWRPLRSRSFLSEEQLAVLHEHFRLNPFPNKYELTALADKIGVSKRVVQVWFQVKFYLHSHTHLF